MHQVILIVLTPIKYMHLNFMIITRAGINIMYKLFVSTSECENKNENHVN